MPLRCCCVPLACHCYSWERSSRKPIHSYISPATATQACRDRSVKGGGRNLRSLRWQATSWILRRAKLSSGRSSVGISDSDVLNLYCELIGLRKRWPCLHNGRKDLTHVDFDEAAHWLRMERGDPSGCRTVLFCNFSNIEAKPALDVACEWTRAISTGPGCCSASLYLADP